jgi:4-carboxymuconolactone decarboxylase
MSKDQQQPDPQEQLNKRKAFVPKLMELNEQVLFGDIWERPGLSKRDRSLITVATLTALYRLNELPFYIKRAMENGVTKEELAEVFTHLAFYAGWPTAMTAVNLAIEILTEAE